MPLTPAGVNNSLPVGALPPGKTKQKRNQPGAWYEGSIASNGGTHERTGHLHALQHVVLLPNDPEAHSKPTGGDLVPFLVSQGGALTGFSAPRDRVRKSSFGVGRQMARRARERKTNGADDAISLGHHAALQRLGTYRW